MADVWRDVPGPTVQLRTSVGSRAVRHRLLTRVTQGAALKLANTGMLVTITIQFPLAKFPSSVNHH